MCVAFLVYAFIVLKVSTTAVVVIDVNEWRKEGM